MLGCSFMYAAVTICSRRGGDGKVFAFLVMFESLHVLSQIFAKTAQNNQINNSYTLLIKGETQNRDNSF